MSWSLCVHRVLYLAVIEAQYVALDQDDEMALADLGTAHTGESPFGR